MIQPTVFNNIISGRHETSHLKKKRNDWRTLLPCLLFPAALILLFILLIVLSIPEGCIFGSHTDWLSQHAALAETIRDACLEQKTLLPSWLDLGGGANGFQFSYYGFLRPDILIGCLLPQVPMVKILIGYMLAVYLASVLLVWHWLRCENIRPVTAFAGSVLFMTAGCMFHMHRQVMFVNYMPFLILAFLCIRKRKFRWLPICLTLIFLSSFYYSGAALAAVGWYWYRTEGKEYFRKYFLRGYVPAALLSVAMAGALLIPTGLILLEHRRGGSGVNLAELFAPNPVLNNILFNEYGMGLTLVCLYAILAGLARRKFRIDSILFLLLGMFGIFSYILNGALYSRPKILIPFMPLVILHCVRFLQDAAAGASDEGVSLSERRKHRAFPTWPFLIMIPVSLLWVSQVQFPWIMTELILLLLACLVMKFYYGRPQPLQGRAPLLAGTLCSLLILIAPTGMYLTTAGTEDWVRRAEVSDDSSGIAGDEAAEKELSGGNGGQDLRQIYRAGSLLEPLADCNKLSPEGPSRSTMYSSVTNYVYSDFYYDTLMTPIRINNRVAILPSLNPFMLDLMGVRYLETDVAHIPAGYTAVRQSGDKVLAENTQVLPIAYFTDDLFPESEYNRLDPYEKLDILTRYTVTNMKSTAEGTDGKAENFMEDFLPELSLEPGETITDGMKIEKASGGYEISAEKECTLKLAVSNAPADKILLLQFHVENLSRKAVVIDINDIRNKLSGPSAPYPNGNECFHYQFCPTPGEGVESLEITFSKGHYILRDIRWLAYDVSHFSDKSVTPLIPVSEESLPEGNDGAGSGGMPADSGRVSKDSGHVSEGSHLVLAGTVTADSDGLFATSIPLQNGLEILVDGKAGEIMKVNEAFAGTWLKEGTHFIEIRFSPPGKTAGILISLLALAGYAGFLIWDIRIRKVQKMENPA